MTHLCCSAVSRDFSEAAVAAAQLVRLSCASSPLPEITRPDKSDLILLAANFRWRDVPVDVAVPRAAGPKLEALEWLLAFTERSRRLVIYQIAGEWFAFGPLAFQMAMSKLIDRGETPWLK